MTMNSRPLSNSTNGFSGVIQTSCATAGWATSNAAPVMATAATVRSKQTVNVPSAREMGAEKRSEVNIDSALYRTGRSQSRRRILQTTLKKTTHHRINVRNESGQFRVRKEPLKRPLTG